MPSGMHKLFLTLLLCSAACAPRSAPAPATTTTLPGPRATAPASRPASTASPTAMLASPSPTHTLRAAPRLFSESFDGPAPYWTYQQAGNRLPMAAPEIRDGFLVFDLTEPNQWAYAVYGGPDMADVNVEAQVQDRTGGDGAAGVVCRYDKNAGWYELDVFADGSYQLLYGRWLAAGVASYAPLYQGASEAIQADENAIGLKCQGNSLIPSINGHAQRQWQELKFGLKQGKVGLSVSSFSAVPLVIAFDSVKVSEP